MDRQGYDEKLARILRTAAAEIAENGFHNTGMRDISRATGVSLAGLYYYFRSKDELLFLIQDHCFGTVLDNLERRLEGETDPRVRLRILVENHLRFFAANMKEMKVLSHEASALTGEFRAVVNAKKRRYTEICMAIVEQLGGDGCDGSARSATFALFGMLNWIYNWYDPERDVPVGELAGQMTQLFLQGYCPAGAAGAGGGPTGAASAERAESAGSAASAAGAGSAADAANTADRPARGGPSIWRTGGRG